MKYFSNKKAFREAMKESFKRNTPGYEGLSDEEKENRYRVDNFNDIDV